MNIPMMQMLSQRSVSPTKSSNSQTNSAPINTTAKTNTSIDTTKSTKDDLSKFGSVFDQVISSTKPATKTTSQDATNTGLEQVASVLNVQSVEELLDLLEIPHDNGLLMIQVEKDGKAVAIDEMLKLEDLMAALNIDAEQFMQVVQQLLGEDQQAKDVWELLALVDAQAPLLQSQLVATLQGDQSLSPKEASQFVQLLKFVELLGSKTDLTSQQEGQLENIKNILAAIQTKVEMVQVTPQTTTKTTVTIPLQGFQQVVTQQVTQQVTQTTQQKTETNTNEVVTANTVQTKTDTFQVTLPSAKPAQSEALLKEMQAIINRSQISNAQGITRLTLKLYPENLGTIRIELVQNDGVITARLLASTAHGRELLDSQVHQLKQAFVQQNIQVDRLDIAQSLQDADRQQRDQSFFNNFFKGQQEDDDESHVEDEEETISFSDYLKNEEV